MDLKCLHFVDGRVEGAGHLLLLNSVIEGVFFFFLKLACELIEMLANRLWRSSSDLSGVLIDPWLIRTLDELRILLVFSCAFSLLQALLSLFEPLLIKDEPIIDF